jgi:hypothetical protein
VCALAVMRTTVDLRRAPWHRNAQRGPPLAGLRSEDPPPDALWSKMEQLLYTVHRILRPQTFADYYTALANYGVVPRQVLRLGPKAAAALQAAVREVALQGTCRVREVPAGYKEMVRGGAEGTRSVLGDRRPQRRRASRRGPTRSQQIRPRATARQRDWKRWLAL